MHHALYLALSFPSSSLSQQSNHTSGNHSHYRHGLTYCPTFQYQWNHHYFILQNHALLGDVAQPPRNWSQLLASVPAQVVQSVHNTFTLPPDSVALTPPKPLATWQMTIPFHLPNRFLAPPQSCAKEVQKCSCPQAYHHPTFHILTDDAP